MARLWTNTFAATKDRVRTVQRQKLQQQNLEDLYNCVMGLVWRFHSPWASLEIKSTLTRA